MQTQTGQAAVPATAASRFALDLLRLARPKQWLKNVYVLAAAIFSRELLVGAAWPACVGFLCFCLTSSSVYILNDIVDVERDRLHPIKRLRPIAAGQVTTRLAWVVLATLPALWIPAALWLSPRFLAVSLGYFLLNVAYSLWLKNVFLLDVAVIAGGFVLRALAGGVLARVALSPWLITCTVLLSLLLGFGKRRSELLTAGRSHRGVLAHYTVPFLDRMITALTWTTITGYALYTVDSTTGHRLVWTLPCVAFGLLRYRHLTLHTGVGGAPEDVLTADRPMLVNVVLWGVSVAVLLYLM